MLTERRPSRLGWLVVLTCRLSSSECSASMFGRGLANDRWPVSAVAWSVVLFFMPQFRALRTAKFCSMFTATRDMISLPAFRALAGSVVVAI